MERYAHRILHVARERWMAELDKLLVGPSVVYALELLAATGLLRFMLPGARSCRWTTTRTRRYHDRTLFEHTLGVVEATPPDVTLRWARAAARRRPSPSCASRSPVAART